MNPGLVAEVVGITEVRANCLPIDKVNAVTEIQLRPVIMVGDVSRVGRAVEIGQDTVRIALQSIWLGIALSLGLMVIAAFGFIPATLGAGWMLTPCAGAKLCLLCLSMVWNSTVRLGKTSMLLEQRLSATLGIRSSG